MKHLPLYTFENLFRDFEKTLSVKGYKKEQLCSQYLREFLFFLEKEGIRDIIEVTAGDVIKYTHYLMERPNERRPGTLSTATQKRHIQLIRLFFDQLMDSGAVQASPVGRPKFSLNHSLSTTLNLEEIGQLNAACETLRDKALMALSYGCGLRRMEIYHLNILDINFSSGQLFVKKGKYSKSRAIPLSDTTLAVLREYLVYERSKLEKPGENSPAFLLCNRGERIKTYWPNYRFHELVRKTGNTNLINKNPTLHSLRHSIATHLLDKGAEFSFVQNLLGHALSDTTHLYSKRRKQGMVLTREVNRYEANQKVA